MDESKILSREEVNALLKAAQEKDSDLSKLINPHSHGDYPINYKAAEHIVDLGWSECEKIFSSFIRKKVNVKPKNKSFGKLAECIAGREEKHVFTIFHITTTNDFCMVIIGLPLLHQMINALYGGVVNGKEPIMESTGNIGIIVAEKICELALESFCLACKEYGKISYEKLKTVTLPALISKLSMEDEVFSLTYDTIMGDISSELIFVFPIKFLHAFLPKSPINDEENAKLKHLWHDAIKQQVIDSNVTLIASLPEVMVNTKDLLELKAGDLIPISDPTIVDVYLNDVKLFCANAAQANATRIIKILNEP